MEENNATQVEATPAETTEPTAEAAPSEMSETEEEEFESAFNEDGPEPQAEETPAEENPAGDEPAKGDSAKEEPKIAVGGREYTAEDIAGILDRVTELQGAVNTPPPERALIEKLAAQAGMRVDEFVENAETAILEGATAARAQQLEAQGIEPEMARHIAELEVKAKANENMRAAMENRSTTAQTAQQEAKARFDAQVAEFDRMFPDVKEPPDEVFEEMRRTGASPIVAYQNYLLRQREAELNALRQEQKNKEKSTGSARGNQAEPEDPFLVELMK